MNESFSTVSEQDPREELFVVPADMLADDQILGLVEEYCTRYHGLNDQENPLVEASRVKAAVDKGELVVWFDPVTNTASLDRPQAQR
ncbi:MULTISPECIES: hypothetical protein [unclassified Marinobacter]|uniref:hypothetical protein n=1 Tax=unclassified Marinobacter TaxID=83889 RepID=UPI000BF66511|nr:MULTISPECIES: hypothetical protein [unclassified Marinobacter]PFG08461.1 hypothetical protein ATI45_0729 [Marinobacter sp. LV10MA510-1]PFG54259.1 hypothetical protein ATG98_3470 [Marinobacter sp. LV10R520-4]